MLNIDTKTAVPIWKQIEDEMRRLVAVGMLNVDSAVPSVRELALQLRVNPATVSKAYQRLCDAGVLVVRRGEGTFVATNQPSLRKTERRQALTRAADQYAAAAMTIGSTVEEALTAVHEAFERLDEAAKEQQSRRQS
jgi:GntR family transcriptional regulator